MADLSNVFIATGTPLPMATLAGMVASETEAATGEQAPSSSDKSDGESFDQLFQRQLADEPKAAIGANSAQQSSKSQGEPVAHGSRHTPRSHPDGEAIKEPSMTPLAIETAKALQQLSTEAGSGSVAEWLEEHSVEDILGQLSQADQAMQSLNDGSPSLTEIIHSLKNGAEMAPDELDRAMAEQDETALLGLLGMGQADADEMQAAPVSVNTPSQLLDQVNQTAQWLSSNRELSTAANITSDADSVSGPGKVSVEPAVNSNVPEGNGASTAGSKAGVSDVDVPTAAKGPQQGPQHSVTVTSLNKESQTNITDVANEMAGKAATKAEIAVEPGAKVGGKSTIDGKGVDKIEDGVDPVKARTETLGQSAQQLMSGEKIQQQSPAKNNGVAEDVLSDDVVAGSSRKTSPQQVSAAALDSGKPSADASAPVNQKITADSERLSTGEGQVAKQPDSDSSAASLSGNAGMNTNPNSYSNGEASKPPEQVTKVPVQGTEQTDPATTKTATTTASTTGQQPVIEADQKAASQTTSGTAQGTSPSMSKQTVPEQMASQMDVEAQAQAVAPMHRANEQAISQAPASVGAAGIKPVNQGPAAEVVDEELTVESEVLDGEPASMADESRPKRAENASLNLFQNLLERQKAEVNTATAVQSEANTEQLAKQHEDRFTAELNALRSVTAQRESQGTEAQPGKVSLQPGLFAPQTKDRISMMLANNLKEATIQLDPAELGSMNIRVSVQNDQMNISFQVQNPQAKEMLENSMERLKEMLSEQGIALGDSQVNQEQQQAAEEQMGSEGLAGRGIGDTAGEGDEHVVELTLQRENRDGIDFYA